jgi:hypothetical protein
MTTAIPSLAAALVLALPAAAALAGEVTLLAGDSAGRHASLTFAADRGAADALVIETRQVGNPGAKLTISIDRSASPLYAMILGERECSFDDRGAMCRIALHGGTPAYDRFVTAFRKGRTAHVEVRNASVMEMRENVSLIGFTRAFGR